MKAVAGFVTATALALVFLGTVHAQTFKKVPRVGFVFSAGSPRDSSPAFDAFRQGLQERGYVDGKNILLEKKYAMGRLDQMPALVDELVQANVDVIVGVNNVVIRAAQEATKTIPIVMVTSIDPVAAGYVESFARPGKNLTGVTYLSREISGKRIELLKELFPKISRVAVLWDGEGPGPAIAFKEYKSSAQTFNLELFSVKVQGPNPEFDEHLEAAKKAGSEALIVVGNPLIGQHAKQIFQLAIKRRLPTMTEDRRRVVEGGLVSYGADLVDVYRTVAKYVDEILKGAKPANMLVQQAAVFEIFVNMKTAKQLNLEIPRSVLLRANELIE